MRCAAVVAACTVGIAACRSWSERLDRPTQDDRVLDRGLIVVGAPPDGTEAELLVESASDSVGWAHLEEDFAHAAARGAVDDLLDEPCTDPAPAPARIDGDVAELALIDDTPE